MTNTSASTEIKGIPVTRFQLGEADAVTSVTLPASLLNEANRDGLSGLNRLPKLTSITLDGKSDSGFVSGSAVYLSDGTMTELIAAARQREGRAWSIPEGVTSIGTGIVCDTAKSLILPASLQNADGNMILSALENVTAAKGNASFRVIGGALYHLGENGKPDSLVLLPEKSGIKALDIPEGVRQVGKLRCDTLEAICFPASAQTITTFSHGIGSSRLSALQEIQVAAGNPCFTSEYGVLYGVECSIDEARGTFVATDGGKPAYFAACPDSYPSETLTLPDSVTIIESSAFYGCESLKGIKIPAGVNMIEWRVFSKCVNLENIDVDENNGEYCSIDGVMFTKNKAMLRYYPAGKKDEEFTVPDETINISIFAFSNCANLKKITIPLMNNRIFPSRNCLC